jgi:transmembrane sensor
VENINAEIQLLTRHLSGMLSPPEEARLREWMAADPSHPRLLRALQDGWELSSILPPLPYDADAAFSRVVDRIASPEAHGTDVPEVVKAPGVRRRRAARTESLFASGAWRAAAGVLLVAGSGLLWQSLHRAPAASESADLVIEVPRGQEARLRLPDGSRVVLAPESKLRYPRSFGEHARDLQLDGMGYFEVVHDSERPFVVRAGGAVVRDLGTTFVVRAYADARQVEVAVTEGSVSLRADSIPPDRAVSLTHGQVGRLDRNGVARLEHGRAPSTYLDWMDGQPVIHNLPLPEALAEIERWYDVELSIGDSRLTTRRITTRIERSSLNETLAVIALALDAKIVSRGDTLVFVHNR